MLRVEVLPWHSVHSSQSVVLMVQALQRGLNKATGLELQHMRDRKHVFKKGKLGSTGSSGPQHKQQQQQQEPGKGQGGGKAAAGAGSKAKQKAKLSFAMDEDEEEQ